MNSKVYIRNVNISKLLDIELEEPYRSLNKYIEHFVANMHKSKSGIYKLDLEKLYIKIDDDIGVIVFGFHSDNFLKKYNFAYRDIKEIFKYHIYESR